MAEPMVRDLSSAREVLRRALGENPKVVMIIVQRGDGSWYHDTGKNVADGYPLIEMVGMAQLLTADIISWLQGVTTLEEKNAD